MGNNGIAMLLEELDVKMETCRGKINRWDEVINEIRCNHFYEDDPILLNVIKLLKLNIFVQQVQYEELEREYEKLGSQKGWL